MKSPEEMFADKSELLGKGACNEVHKDRINPDYVVKLKQRNAGVESSERYKGLFARVQYRLGKIAHILFPQNIPDIHLTSYKMKRVNKIDDLGEDHLVTQRFGTAIREGRVTEVLRREYKDAQERVLYDPRTKEFVAKMRAAGLPYDPMAKNFGFDREGNAVYVDDFAVDDGFAVDVHLIDEPSDPERMKLAIDGIEDEKTRKEAQKHFERLMLLIGELREERKREKEKKRD